jgi:hypothetical protein
VAELERVGEGMGDSNIARITVEREKMVISREGDQEKGHS